MVDPARKAGVAEWYLAPPEVLGDLLHGRAATNHRAARNIVAREALRPKMTTIKICQELLTFPFGCAMSSGDGQLGNVR